MRVLKLSLKAASQLVERHVCLRQAAEPLMSSFCAKLGSLSGQPPLYVTFSHLGLWVTLTPDEFGNAVKSTLCRKSGPSQRHSSLRARALQTSHPSNVRWAPSYPARPALNSFRACRAPFQFEEVLPHLVEEWAVLSYS
jgi:hypothetical protein